jgi:hypothetical protein
MRPTWALSVPLSISLLAGCDTVTPSSLPGPLPAVEAAAGSYARLASIVSPGTRIALDLRSRLLSRLHPYQAALRPTTEPWPEDPAQRWWDALEPELRDPGLVRAGVPLRFPEIGIGAPDLTQPLPSDVPGEAGDETIVQAALGDPALVGAYQAGQALLILDAAGGFSLAQGGRTPSLRGTYAREGQRIVLRAGEKRRALTLAAADALRDGDGVTYRLLTGDAP